MPTTLHENRPSAGIGVVEVQKPMFFLRFLKFPRDPLRGSAWSRCKNPWFFAISAVLARPSAGIGVVEVQKLEVFCDFQHTRATLCGDRRGRGAKTHGFFSWTVGIGRWFASSKSVAWFAETWEAQPVSKRWHGWPSCALHGKSGESFTTSRPLQVSVQLVAAWADHHKWSVSHSHGQCRRHTAGTSAGAAAGQDCAGVGGQGGKPGACLRAGLRAQQSNVWGA